MVVAADLKSCSKTALKRPFLHGKGRFLWFWTVRQTTSIQLQYNDDTTWRAKILRKSGAAVRIKLVCHSIQAPTKLAPCFCIAALLPHLVRDANDCGEPGAKQQVAIEGTEDPFRRHPDRGDDHEASGRRCPAQSPAHRGTVRRCMHTASWSTCSAFTSNDLWAGLSFRIR